MIIKNNQINRLGAYGVILQGCEILLTLKKSGPYRGLWGLPGGAIEFGETPEQALKREILEETAYQAEKVELLRTATSLVKYTKNGDEYDFHHIGIIYMVSGIESMTHAIAEEEARWIAFADLKQEELTPFARDILPIISPTNPLVWRPSRNIRAKVIGIVKHQNRLLVCEVRNDESVLKGWCPLGGGVEFSETSEDALKREIYEELGCDIVINGTSIAYDNIFEHHGAKGHEIILAYPISLVDPKIYEKKRFQIRENNGALIWVEWIDIERFTSGKEVLFPNALMSAIISH